MAQASATALAKRDEEQPSALDLLTDRERKFALLYVGEANCVASEAARLMGYKEGGSDSVVGSRLLGDVRVRAAIDELLADMEVSARECMGRLARIVRFDYRRLLSIQHEDRCASHSGEECDCEPDVRVNLGKRAAGLDILQRIGRDRSGNWTAELPSRTEALALIARRHKLLSDHLHVTQEVEYVVRHTGPGLEEPDEVIDAEVTQDPPPG